MSVIKASHVFKVFGRREDEMVRRLKAGADRKELRALGTAAVIDVSFDVQPGEIFVVMGLSGSGKSTLIRTLNGLWAPSSGQIEVMGNDISKMNATQLREVRRDHISMVFQHFALLPHRTVRENAAYGLEIQGVDAAERTARADKWLKRVGLGGWGDKYPGELSGGMQQRVGLARALCAETDILLMDEAFSALDPLIRRDMQQLLITLQRELQKTIVFITHDLNEAMLLGDRIAVMRDGRIVQIGTAEEILTAPADDYVAEFIQDVDRSRVLTASSVMHHPAGVVTSTTGPHLAIRNMREAGLSGLLVTDRNDVLLGMITDSDAVEAAHAGKQTVYDIIQTADILTVQPDVSISELFAPSATSRVPLCVVDENNKLLGVIPRVVLLDAMSTDSHSTGQLPAVNGGANGTSGDSAETSAVDGPGPDGESDTWGEPHPQRADDSTAEDVVHSGSAAASPTKNLVQE